MKILDYLPQIRWGGRLLWWGALVAVMSRYLYVRLPDLKAGLASTADIIVFFVWIAVALLPLLTEITFFGVTFKKDIEALKSDIKEDIETLRTEVQTAVTVKQQLSQQFILPSAPSDSQLPDLEKKLKDALDRELAARGVVVRPVTDAEPPSDANYLFSIRYQIEKEARRIVFSRPTMTSDMNRRATFGAVVSSLMHLEVLDPQIARAAREIYSICSLAIHGEDVSPAKVDFVRDLGPRVLAALKAVEN